MKPTYQELMANAGIPDGTALWTAELALALRNPAVFAEVICDETLVQTPSLAGTYSRFEMALRASRQGFILAGPEYREIVEARLEIFCQQLLDEGTRRGVVLVSMCDGEVMFGAGLNPN